MIYHKEKTRIFSLFAVIASWIIYLTCKRATAQNFLRNSDIRVSSETLPSDILGLGSDDTNHVAQAEMTPSDAAEASGRNLGKHDSGHNNVFVQYPSGSTTPYTSTFGSGIPYFLPYAYGSVYTRPVTQGSVLPLDTGVFPAYGPNSLINYRAGFVPATRFNPWYLSRRQVYTTPVSTVNTNANPESTLSDSILSLAVLQALLRTNQNSGDSSEFYDGNTLPQTGASGSVSLADIAAFQSQLQLLQRQHVQMLYDYFKSLYPNASELWIQSQIAEALPSYMNESDVETVNNTIPGTRGPILSEINNWLHLNNTNSQNQTPNQEGYQQDREEADGNDS